MRHPVFGIKWQTISRSLKRAATMRDSGNVFADLNLPYAEERQTKLRLAYALNAVIDAERLTQEAAATRLDLSLPILAG